MVGDAVNNREPAEIMLIGAKMCNRGGYAVIDLLIGTAQFQTNAITGLDHQRSVDRPLRLVAYVLPRDRSIGKVALFSVVITAQSERNAADKRSFDASGKVILIAGCTRRAHIETKLLAGILRDVIDRTCKRITAKQGGLRPLDDFHALQFIDADGLRAAAHVNAIQKHCRCLL